MNVDYKYDFTSNRASITQLVNTKFIEYFTSKRELLTYPIKINTGDRGAILADLEELGYKAKTIRKFENSPLAEQHMMPRGPLSIFEFEKFDMFFILNKELKELISFACVDNIELLETLSRTISKKRAAKQEVIFFKEFFISQGMMGPELTDNVFYKKIEDFKSNKKYYPYFKDDIDVFFKNYFLSRDNILVLSGMPGTGKTKMIDLYMKFLMSNKSLVKKTIANKQKSDMLDDYLLDRKVSAMEKELDMMKESGIKSSNSTPIADDEELNLITQVWYVKNEDVLVNDDFWQKLRATPPSLLVLDDLDNFLGHRTKNSDNSEDAKRNRFINQLLSFTDGLNDNDICKIIITTNLDVRSDIDNALLRANRTFTVLELPLLSYQEALDIWLSEELQKSDFEPLFEKDSQVTSSELSSTIQKYLKLKELDQKVVASYFDRDSIDITKTINEHYRGKIGKIGF
jgi:hypothetical protein